MNNSNEKIDVANLSPGALSFVGDAVYGLMVREKLVEINRPVGVLHNLSVDYVNAAAQAKAFKEIEPVLTEKELGVYKRGRNLHTNNTPKASTEGEYHSATGLEALFGFLYLSGNTQRLNELFDIICRAF